MPEEAVATLMRSAASSSIEMQVVGGVSEPPEKADGRDPGSRDGSRDLRVSQPSCFLSAATFALAALAISVADFSWMSRPSALSMPDASTPVA